MTPKPFMISIQWGRGHHYFHGVGAFSYEDAVKIAKARYEQLELRANKRGFKPRIMIWELRESIQTQSVGPLTWDDHV